MNIWNPYMYNQSFSAANSEHYDVDDEIEMEIDVLERNEVMPNVTHPIANQAPNIPSTPTVTMPMYSQPWAMQPTLMDCGCPFPMWHGYPMVMGESVNPMIPSYSPTIGTEMQMMMPPMTGPTFSTSVPSAPMMVPMSSRTMNYPMDYNQSPMTHEYANPTGYYYSPNYLYR